MVGYQHKGANCLRARAISISNPRTPRQQMQRRKVSAVVGFLKIINPYIRIGYRNYATGGGAYHAAMSYLMRRAVTAEGDTAVLDFDRVMVAIGFLSGVTDAAVGVEGHTALFRWTDNSGSGNADSTDLAMPLIYNKERETAVYRTDAATRADACARLELPRDWEGDTLIAYLSFRTADGKEASNSVRVQGQTEPCRAYPHSGEARQFESYLPVQTG